MKPIYERVVTNLKSPISLYRWWRYQNGRPKDLDTYLITMTGAGTHWLRTMLSKALIETYNLSDEITSIRHHELVPPFLNKRHRFKYNHVTNIPRIQHSHSPYFFIFHATRIILLVRDLRDAIVSHYRTYIAMKKKDVPNFSDFLRGRGLDPRRLHTLTSRIDFLNSWSQNAHKLAAVDVLRFEDLRADTPGQLQRILHFAGFPPTSKDLIERVVDFGSIDRMREMEKESPLPQYKNKLCKIREGRIGTYHEYFDDDDRRYFSKIVSEKLIETYGYDYDL